MEKYLYDGPIMIFDKVFTDHYRAITFAQTPAKALSNFKFQAKNRFGLTANSKISLPGKVCKEQRSLFDERKEYGA